ncbi:MAG TPA: M48 family metalloprotease [Candidatus Acidoferrum sp.]|nr:M48 family metalloprotease [Candidatus Acidoferrum sp.]
MASLNQLKGTMLITILITLIVFVGFVSVVSYFFSIASNFSFSLIDTLAGAFILAFIFMLIEFAISPYIVRATTRLRYLNPGENPWLEGVVAKLSNAASVKQPRLAIVPDSTPNAFVFGNSSNNMTLAVNQGLLTQLNEDEVQGVIGHELGHVRHKDSIVMTFLSAIPLIAYVISRAAFGFGYVGGGRRDERGGGAAYIVAAGVIALIVYFVSQLLVLRLSRLRESFADAFSAYLTSAPRELESALTRITYGLSLSPQEPHGARALFISDPSLAKEEVREILNQKNKYDLDHDGVLDEHELELAMQQEARSRWSSVNGMFATHPPTYKRILLLRQIDQEITSRGLQTDNIYSKI